METDPRSWPRRIAKRWASGLLAAGALTGAGLLGLQVAQEAPAEGAHMVAVASVSAANTAIKKTADDVNHLLDPFRKLVPVPHIEPALVPQATPPPIAANPIIHYAKVAAWQEALTPYNSLEFSRKVTQTAELGFVATLGAIGCVVLRPSKLEKAGRREYRQLKHDYDYSPELAQAIVGYRFSLFQQAANATPQQLASGVSMVCRNAPRSRPQQRDVRGERDYYPPEPRDGYDGRQYP